MKTMQVTRVHAGADGVSHFGALEISLSDAGPIGWLSTVMPATGVIFRETAADYDFDWHPAPRRQLVVLLDGAIEIEVGDGERRRFAGGDIVLVEDTTGRGHRTRTIDGRPRRSLFIALE